MLCFLLPLLALLAGARAGGCEYVSPLLTTPGPALGLITIPGAHLPGETYLPLLRAIQAAYPGTLWLGATSHWAGEMPTPFEVSAQITACLAAAESDGQLVDNVIMAGHSLGGVVLQSYIALNPQAAKAVGFIGTWLPDLAGPGSNAYTVPVGTFIGELDGGGISYLRREVEETAALPKEERWLAKTVLVPAVNHAQVSSGLIPQDVIDNDIDPELSEEAAHAAYGARLSDWMVLQAGGLGLLGQETVFRAVDNFTRYEAETAAYLEPLVLGLGLEQQAGAAVFVAAAQEAILDLEEPEAAVVKDEILTNFLLFQAYHPDVAVSAGIVRIITYSYLEYDLDILDFNNHLSASTVKAKMKLADAIYPLLGLPARGEVRQCAELNRATMEWALSVASPVALERMEAMGRSLTFGPDVESQWGGAGWEYSGGLQWEEDSNNYSVKLTAAKLTSAPSSPIFPGEHYCDLLSPYRALEWIYIESIRHTMQF